MLISWHWQDNNWCDIGLWSSSLSVMMWCWAVVVFNLCYVWQVSSVHQSVLVWQRVVDCDTLTVEQRQLLESLCITVSAGFTWCYQFVSEVTDIVAVSILLFRTSWLSKILNEESNAQITFSCTNFHDLTNSRIEIPKVRAQPLEWPVPLHL